MRGLGWFIGIGLKWAMMLAFVRGVVALSGDVRRARNKDKRVDENPGQDDF